MSKLYPVIDRLTGDDLKQLGLRTVKGPYPSMGMPAKDVHAIATGEKRPPRKGEWYLSGAIVEAYRAPNDLSTPHHIARLVRTKTETTTKIIEL